MGRNKPAFTGHKELKTSFQRKGGFKKSEINGADIRTYLQYTQLEHKPGYGYIYMIDYDGHIFYNVFKEHYYETDDGATACTYPGDAAFYENKYQWAWTTNTLEDAKEILETFESIF